MNNDNNQNQNQNLRIGKYLVSPLLRGLDNGWIACSVSIRSGTGSATTDRVVRLTRLFRNPIAAVEYAIAEGRKWIGAPSPMALPCGAAA